MVAIRSYCPTDLNAVVSTIRASITQLCQKDHQNDPEKLASWLVNKTKEALAEPLAAANSACFVAVDAGDVVGVVHILVSGEITLCYVHPQAIGKGVGQRLITTAFEFARTNGLQNLTLEATQTAKPFYERMGFVRLDKQSSCGKVSCLSMRKVI